MKYILSLISIIPMLALASNEGTPGERIKTKPPVFRTTKELMTTRACPRVSRGITTPSVVASNDATIGNNFLTMTFDEVNTTPPDTMGVIGPKQFIIHTNQIIRSFDKVTGKPDGVLNLDNDHFFVGGISGCTDTEIRYDSFSDRWFLTTAILQTPDRILVATSDSGVITPTTTWRFDYFEVDQVSPAGDLGNLADFPSLGVDQFALYIGVDMFPPSTILTAAGCGEFAATATAFVIQKESLLGTGPMVVNAFRQLQDPITFVGPFAPRGVDNYDANPPYGYIAGFDIVSRSNIVLRRIFNPGSTSPSISTNIFVPIAPVSEPLNIPHKGNIFGTDGYIDSNCTEFINPAHIRNGHLWLSTNIGVDSTGNSDPMTITPDRTASAWYEVDITLASPVVIQSGTVFDPTITSSPLSYWMPSVMTNTKGDMLIGFSVAGANSFVNAAFAYRLAGDPAGSTRAPSTFTTSSSAYNFATNEGNADLPHRWGDYSMSSLDPIDGITFWTLQEWVPSTDNFGCQAAQITLPNS